MSARNPFAPPPDVGYLLPEETTGHPLRCVSFLIPDAIEYRAALVRQLYDLGSTDVWDRNDLDQAESAAQVWRDTLQSSLTLFDDAPCPTDETGCNQFSPGAPFIQWFPNDPYNTPDLVPAGYSSPPWYLATTASNLAYGSSTLDVITTLDRLPPGSLPDVLPSSGLPRFRINVTGEGEINIHLVNLFAGSIIQLTLDDDPLTVKFIDVSKDVISVPPETLQEFVIPVQFDTPGDHHVDCIVVAWVNDTFPFLFFGAGLRQVDLCGFATMPTVPPTMIRSDPSGCGNLEKSTDGGTTWTDIADTDFLRRDGVCEMTGTLTVDNASGIGVKLQKANVDYGVLQEASTYLQIKAQQRLQLAGGTAGYLQISENGNVRISTGAFAGITQNQRLRIDAQTGDQNALYVSTPSNAIPLAQFIRDPQIFAQINGQASLDMQDSLLMSRQSSTLTRRYAGQIINSWANSTDAARRARMIFSVYDWIGAKEVMRASVTTVNTPAIGFLGAAEQPRLALTGDCQGNVVTKHIAELLALFGLATDATTLGTAYTPPAAINVTGDKFGNEALASLITGLDTANVINDLTSDTGAYEYMPPAPIDVEGSWQGLEVGKALALALAENDYIVDLTEVNSTDDLTIDRRCAATAACRWMLQQLYYLAGSEMCYDNVAYVSESRWVSVQAYVLTNGLHVETQDFMFERWADPLYDTFGENNSPVVTFAEHFDELVAYLPTIEEAFYCSLTTSGILTSDGRLEFLDLMLATNLTGDVPQDIETWFYQFVRHFSEVDFGLMIAAALQTDYASTIDCSAFVCASSGFSWCKQYNFTLGTYTPPFEIVSGDHVFGATFNPGWKTDDAGILRIEFPFPTNQVTIKYNVTIPDDAYVVLFGSLDGMFEANLSVEGGIYEETIEIPEAFRADGWYFRAACNPVNCVVTIKFVTNMQGTGIEPTDLNDC